MAQSGGKKVWDKNPPLARDAATSRRLKNSCIRILAFIDFFNDTLAKPFRWTYIGKPLLI